MSPDSIRYFNLHQYGMPPLSLFQLRIFVLCMPITVQIGRSQILLAGEGSVVNSPYCQVDRRQVHSKQSVEDASKSLGEKGTQEPGVARVLEGSRSCDED